MIACPTRRFANADELGDLVADDLALILSERFQERPDHPPPAVQSPLPTPFDRTFGRDEDIERVADLIRLGHRLVTLTGAGGVGKSRLSLEVASRLADDFDGLVVFVPLSQIDDPALVLTTLAERLGLRVGGQDTNELRTRVVEALGGRRTLLVLDNFEHVASAGPEIGSVLEASGSATALVTSRHVLRIHGEREYQVAPLETSAATDLFIERAGAVRPGFSATSGEDRTAAEIARRLDGLPLAIELAAASMRVYSAEALLERLDEGADVLSRGASDAPERQRTLRKAMDWSYELLRAGERRLFAQLAVFSGGLSIDSAQEVCAQPEEPDVLEALAGLVEKSLLVPVAESGGEPRLRMLETVRAYALERLAEDPDRHETERRHTEWALRLVGRGAQPGAADRYGPAWLRRIDLERANLRAVLERALRERDAEVVVEMTRAMIGYLALRDSELEGVRWLTAALERPEETPALTCARLRLYLAILVGGLGDYQRAESLRQKARTTSDALLDDPFDRAVDATIAVMTTGAFEPGPRSIELAVDAALEWRASGESQLGEGYMWLLAGTLALSFLPERAVGYFTEALTLAEAMENDGLRAHIHTMLAFSARREGREDDARAIVLRAAKLARGGGFRSGLAYALDGLAAVAIDDRRYEQAAEALAASEAARLTTDRKAWASYHPILAELKAAVAAQLSPDAYAAAWQRGLEQDVLHVVDEGISAAASGIPASVAQNGLTAS